VGVATAQALQLSAGRVDFPERLAFLFAVVGVAGWSARSCLRELPLCLGQSRSNRLHGAPGHGVARKPAAAASQAPTKIGSARKIRPRVNDGELVRWHLGPDLMIR